jgi:hypothetical protein
MKLATLTAALCASMSLTTACARESDAAAPRAPNSPEALSASNTTQDPGSPRPVANAEATPTDRQVLGEPNVELTAEKAAFEASVKDRLARSMARLSRLETTVQPAKRPKLDSQRAALLDRERTLQGQLRSIGDVTPTDWSAFSKSLDGSVALFETDVAQLDDDLVR